MEMPHPSAGWVLFFHEPMTAVALPLVPQGAVVIVPQKHLTIPFMYTRTAIWARSFVNGTFKLVHVGTSFDKEL